MKSICAKVLLFYCFCSILLIRGKYENSSFTGMDTTTAIRIFLKQTLIQRKIPFEIVQDNSFYSEKNIKALEHSKTQMETGQHSIRELVEV